MRCSVLHKSKGRIRVHIMRPYMTMHQADILEYYLRSKPFVTMAKVYDRTGDAVICYKGSRKAVVTALAKFSYEDKAAVALVPEHTGRELDREFEGRLIRAVTLRYARRLLLPKPLQFALSVFHALKYIREALRSLSKGKVEVSVLDATAITVSLIRREQKTAASVMFMLSVGEMLEDWTRKKSVDELASVMSLGVDKVWLHKPSGDVLVPISEIEKGDELVVRTGSMIPLDSVVLSGEAAINQSSLTGESLPVHKTQGSYVYAGTVVEDGSLVIKVDKVSGSGKYDRIVKMIEESEKLKSAAESKASTLADRLVPYCLAGTVLTYLLTRNAMKAMSILMVDFSCALKLAMPISVISAMRECGAKGITVKGGKFLEAVAQADTIVFDKTGTLTHSQPRVAQIVTFAGSDEAEMLRLAACLEQTGEDVPVVATHRVNAPHGPVHAEGNLVTHLNRSGNHASGLESHQAMTGIAVDAVGQHFAVKSFPTFGRELLGRVGPRVAIVEIQHHLKATRLDGLAQVDDIVQILAHTLVMVPSGSILRVHKQAHTHHVPPLLTEQVIRIHRHTARILINHPMAGIGCHHRDVATQPRLRQQRHSHHQSQHHSH